jgi:hypothetical protein
MDMWFPQMQLRYNLYWQSDDGEVVHLENYARLLEDITNKSS